jgi:hypothetical protein
MRHPLNVKFIVALVEALFTTMVIIEMFEFFVYVECHRCTSLGYSHCHIGHRFHHLFISIHHDCVARVAISTSTLLCLLRQQQASSTFSLIALHTVAVLETFFASPFKYWCLFMVVPTFTCPIFFCKIVPCTFHIKQKESLLQLNH